MPLKTESPKKILICEDDASHSKALVEKLAKHDFELQVAGDGNSCLAEAKKNHPDLILLDLILPGKSGFDVLEEIRNDQSLKNTLVVVISNLSDDEGIKKTFKMGASDYFVKSQHPLNEIVEKVAGLLLPG